MDEPKICPDCRGDYYGPGFYCRECNEEVCPLCWDQVHHMHEIWSSNDALEDTGGWFYLLFHKED